MALKAQWNLVLRLWVDNGVSCVCLFGKVGLICQMHQVAKDVGLNCSCKCVWLGHVVSHWERPELCRKWKLFWTVFETKRETLLWVCFHVFDRSRQVRYDLRSLDRCSCLWNLVQMQRGSNIPEGGRYSEVVVRLTGLCVKTTWMQVFPFGLEQSHRTSLDGWTSTEVSASRVWLWDELYGLYSNDCQCGLPMMVVAFPLVEM